jgi:FkbM family methyltransferase
MISRAVKRAIKSILAHYSIDFQHVTPIAATLRDFGFAPQFSNALLELIHSRGENFFFVQLGANDGVQADPIRSYILRYRLRGVLVEPVPDVYARLAESYKTEDYLTFVNGAITEQERTLTLYRPKTDTPGLPDWARGTITANIHQLIGLSFQGFTISENLIESIEVKGIPISEFVTTLPRKIDFLQIDCEGYDLRLLRAFPFHLQTPALINFEHIHIPTEAYVELLRFLAGLGYRFITGGEDTCAVLTAK